MLNDDVRNLTYNRAIRRVAANAHHVLEIGTGSGLRSMMAARAGARRITTCEMVKPLAACAQKIIRDNGYDDRIQVLAKKSTSLVVGKDMPAKADVLIAQVFDVGLIGEHFLPTLFHAKQNLLTEDAVILPAAAKIKGILAECPCLRSVDPIKTISGFDLRAFNMFSAPGYRQFDMRRSDYRALSDAFDVLTIYFQGAFSLSRKETINARTTEAGKLQAIIFWFELILDGETRYSSEHSGSGNHWRQAIHFFTTDFPVVNNEAVQLEVMQQQADLGFKIIS